MGRQTIAEAIRHHGVAHFLFHQVHIHTKLEVSQALLDTVEIGREHGLEWWTCAQINDWERQRRAIRVVANREDGGCVRIVVTTPTAISGATIAIPLPVNGNATTITSQGSILKSTPTTHANLSALLVELDLNAGETVLEMHQTEPSIA